MKRLGIDVVERGLPAIPGDLRAEVDPLVEAERVLGAGAPGGGERGRGRRLLDADGQQDFDAIVTDIDGAFSAIVRGDWSPLTLADEPPLRSGRWIGLVRRAIPAIVLVASALALPHLPGQPPTGDPGVATIQLGLILAAALGLLPVDTDVRGRVINSYASAGKIAP